MEKINFENLPSTNTPLNATNLNQVQTNIDNAKLEKTINVSNPSTKDLNDYTTEGRYYFASAPTNIPVGVNGFLEVLKAGEYVKQIWYRHGTPNSNDFETYVRTYSSNTWSNWNKFVVQSHIDNYSNTETQVGTWYDGKPLYRKTIKIINTAFSDGDNNVAHGIANLKHCIKAELDKEGSHKFPYFNYNPNNQILSMTDISNVDATNITIRLMNDSWGSSNIWYATLYYTKTTD